MNCFQERFQIQGTIHPSEQRGRIQDFHLGRGGGGGAQKIMCPHAHYEHGTELTLGIGVQGPLKPGPGSSRVVLKLSCATVSEPYFLGILIYKKKLD